MSQANLHETAPTQFQDVGDVRLASRIPGMALIFQFPEEFAEAAARFLAAAGETTPITSKRIAR